MPNRYYSSQCESVGVAVEMGFSGESTPFEGTGLPAEDPVVVVPEAPEAPPPNNACVLTSVRIVDEKRCWTGITQPSKYKGFVFDERSDSVSGPFVNNAITALTSRDNTTEVLAINESKEVSKTDLLEFNNPKFKKAPKLEQVYPLINTPIDVVDSEYSVVVSENGDGFSYRGKYMKTPFSEPIMGTGEVCDPNFYRDAYLAIAETNWLHLGDEHNEKQVHRVDLSFHDNSFGDVYCYVANENYDYQGQHKGEIQDHMKVFTNLRGRRFKIKLIIVSNRKYPWALREMSIGHLYGKSF